MSILQHSPFLKILIVEDNPLDQRMLESIIQEENKDAKIDVIDTLKGALEILNQKTFDVVILDLNLPDSKGEETLLKITTSQPDIAIVVNTGVYEDDVGLKTLGIGAQDFLVKGKYNAYWLNKVLNYAVERKRYEMELKAAYDQLKETQGQLIQAEKMKVIGGLASGVAHEVKNPLATILYGVTYLSKHVLIEDKNCQLAMQSIREAVVKANEIITGLLDFASISKLNCKSNDVNQIIEKSINILNHQLERFHVAVIRKFNPNLSKIFVDENRIEQVVVNLILNSCFAMPKGGQIQIATQPFQITKEFLKDHHLDEEFFPLMSEVVVVDVDDDGVGIPSEKLDAIFDPFFTTRRAQGGVGLGLFVCRNIMDIHSGKIIIQNKPDKGVRARLIFRAV